MQNEAADFVSIPLCATPSCSCFASSRLRKRTRQSPRKFYTRQATSIFSPIPAEVLHQTGYVNPIPKPADFTSAMLWGIAIAATRVHRYKKARIEISHAQLTCRIGGRDVVLNDDSGE